MEVDRIRAGNQRPWWKRHWKVVALTVLTAVVIPVSLEWSGTMDLRPFGRGVDRPDPNAPASGKVLSAKSPVVVRWTGQGDTIEFSWAAMTYPGLDHYVARVEALAPIEDWYDPGYRSGEELRLSDVTNPISHVNAGYAEDGKTERVDYNQTWQVCVTAMKKTPGGVDVTPYIIAGSRRCSDVFVIPKAR